MATRRWGRQCRCCRCRSGRHGCRREERTRGREAAAATTTLLLPLGDMLDDSLVGVSRSSPSLLSRGGSPSYSANVSMVPSSMSREGRRSADLRLVPTLRGPKPDILWSRHFAHTSLASGPRRTTERPTPHPFFLPNEAHHGDPRSWPLHICKVRYGHSRGWPIPLRYVCESFSLIGLLLYEKA